MEFLDRKSPTPLYYQLKQKLVEMLGNGEFSPGAPLPTEMELVSTYAVSRATVRQAMKELENEGYISRTAGKGTFVIRTKINRGLSRLTSFSEDMKHLGQKVTSQTLQFHSIPAPEALHQKFGIALGQPLLYIKRLRLSQNNPVALNVSYLNLPEGIQISQDELDQIGSVYSLLERKGIPPLETDRTLEAIAAEEECASLLCVPVGSPLLLVEGLAYSYNHHPIEFHQVISVGGRYKYNIHLVR